MDIMPHVQAFGTAGDAYSSESEKMQLEAIAVPVSQELCEELGVVDDLAREPPKTVSEKETQIRRYARRRAPPRQPASSAARSWWCRGVRESGALFKSPEKPFAQHSRQRQEEEGKLWEEEKQAHKGWVKDRDREVEEELCRRRHRQAYERKLYGTAGCLCMFGWDKEEFAVPRGSNDLAPFCAAMAASKATRGSFFEKVMAAKKAAADETGAALSFSPFFLSFSISCSLLFPLALPLLSLNSGRRCQGVGRAGGGERSCGAPG